MKKSVNFILVILVVILFNVLFTAVYMTNVISRREKITEICEIQKYNYAGENKFKWVVSFSFDDKDEALNFIYKIYGTDK